MSTRTQDPISRAQRFRPTANTSTQSRRNNSQLPQGFPSIIDGSKNWSGVSSSKPQVHTLVLNESQIAEIGKGFEEFCKKELDGNEARRDNFPLPTLKDKLKQCALEIHDGVGVCVIRGIKPECHTNEVNAILHLALGSYVGDQRGIQNSKGDVLYHVTNPNYSVTPGKKRHGIHTSEALPFHTDMGCEILYLQVRGLASEGGHLCVASMATIYNDLVQSDPGVLHTLAEAKWPVQVSRRRSPVLRCPLLQYHKENLLISMDPARLGPHPAGQNSENQQLTPEQKNALSAIELRACKHKFRLELQPGDLVFINNLEVLHARESYIDNEFSSRHLVRLWLRNSELGRPIPDSMKMPWDDVYGNGAEKVRNRTYHIEPMPEYMECKYSNGTAAFVADGDSSSDGGDEKDVIHFTNSNGSN